MPRKQLEDEKIQVARELRRKGYTLEEISHELGISVGTAWKYTRDLFEDRLDLLGRMIEKIVNALASLAGYAGVDVAGDLWCEMFDDLEDLLKKWKKIQGGSED